MSRKFFYRAFYSIYSCSHLGNSELGTIELSKAYCLCVFLYAAEFVPPRASDFRSFGKCIDVVVARVCVALCVARS